MIELLIEKLIAEGKVTREEIDSRIDELKVFPSTSEIVNDIKAKQEDIEDVLISLMDAMLTKVGVD